MEQHRWPQHDGYAALAGCQPGGEAAAPPLHALAQMAPRMSGER